MGTTQNVEMLLVLAGMFNYADIISDPSGLTGTDREIKSIGGRGEETQRNRIP